jgi:hypothetical protein
MLFVYFQVTMGAVQAAITDEYGENVFTTTINTAV